MPDPRPQSPFPDKRLDPPIGPLVEALQSMANCVTLGSCSGHGRNRAYVDLAVNGLDGLRAFIDAVNRVDRAVEEVAIIEVTLNWSEEVVTSCDFSHFPGWVMLSLKIEGPDGPPSNNLLRRVAGEFRRAIGQSATAS